MFSMFRNRNHAAQRRRSARRSLATDYLLEGKSRASVWWNDTGRTRVDV